jgi:hypothetical protein
MLTRPRLALLVLATALAGCYRYRVDVRSQFFGNAYFKGDLTIAGRGPAFRRLLAAATATPVPKLDERLLGVNQTALREAALKSSSWCAPGAARKHADRTSDPANLRELVQDLYAMRGLDTGSRAEVTIKTRQGQVVVSSDSEHAFMLPWTIRRGQLSYSTWNPEIGRALAALLPPSFVNRDRIAGEELVDELVFIADQLGTQRSSDSAEEWLGTQLDPIKRRFRILESRIGDPSDLEESWPKRGGAGVWRATLGSPNLGQLRFSVELDISNGRLVAEPFLSSCDGALRRVRALEWLGPLLVAHPQAHVLISFVSKPAVGTTPDDTISLTVVMDLLGRQKQRWAVEADGRSHRVEE